MQLAAVEQEAEELLKKLTSVPSLRCFVDSRWPVPQVHRVSGEARLIILGQDSTVKNESSRATITMVLNLDKNGSLRDYLAQICRGLGLDLDQNVYATNYFKNFFIRPPTQIGEINVFEEFSHWWFPFLQEELALFPQVPLITLGEPLLSALVCEGVNPLVRHYWGYTPHWQSGERGELHYLKPSENHLGRAIFPFPHQPSLGKRFYRERLSDYVAFVKQKMDEWKHKSGGSTH
jgi:hypothetical protein